MDISVQDAMITAIWRFHNAAMDRATLIYTFARSTYEDRPGFHEIYVRQVVSLIDAVHDFAFSARRAIERAEPYKAGIIQQAQNIRTNYDQSELELSDFDSPHKITFTAESFWWILGRIIHSRDAHVVHRTVDIVVDDKRTGRHHSVFQPVAFEFSSDRDGHRISHYVQLEALLYPYVVGIAAQIEAAIKVRNYVPTLNTDADTGAG